MWSSRGDLQVSREAMVRHQIEARGIADWRVLESMRTVPRHRFVPPEFLSQAYEDFPLPIGPGQTISQPYIVAYMAEALELKGHERVLEVGSGSGYFAAVLSLLAKDVCGIELEPRLALRSAALLAELGYANARILEGDGNLGWQDRAPFEAVVLSCASRSLPEPLWTQLAEGGRALFPRADPGGSQELVLLTKSEGRAQARALLPVVFVPLRRPE